MQKVVTLELDHPITCQGISVRTTNADEMTAGNENSKAKIGDLWQNFYGQFADSLDDNSQIFGIYHNCESDVNGAFDVTSCFANNKELNDKVLKDNLDTVIIPTEKYLVFKKQGAMPQAVIEAWGEVWNYFNSDDCSYRRSYNVDFEKYIGTETVEVYIGIK